MTKQTNYSSDTNLLNCTPNPRKRQDWKLEDFIIPAIPNINCIHGKRDLDAIPKFVVKEFLRKEEDLLFECCDDTGTLDIEFFLKKRRELAGKSLVESK
jgi:hypothetical protein